MLVAATVAALVWANSPWDGGYASFWATNVPLEIGPYRFEEDLVHVVNDVLMAIFFFVVGMEIKRELVDRRASRPSIRRPPRHCGAGGHDRAGGDLRRIQRGR